MDKNVVIAIVLSFAIIFGFTFVQQKYFTPDEDQLVETQESVENTATAENTASINTSSNSNQSDINLSIDEQESSAPLRTISGETELFKFSFTTEGAILTSLELKEHKDNDELVNMVYQGDTDRGAFEVSFGQNSSNPIEKNFFYVDNSDPDTYSFYQDFTVTYGDGTISAPFRLIKTFRFIPDEYMMEVVITLENSENDFLPLNYDGYSYTLTYGPQIGPSFTKLDGRYAYRNLISYNDNKLNTYNGRAKNRVGTFETQEYVEWSGIIGKYFGVAAITNSSRYKISWSNEPIQGLQDTAFLHLSRPVIESSKNSDIYRFYIGPKDKKILEAYNNSSENSYGYADIHIDAMSQSGGVLGWLEAILKWILGMIYKVIPNYGIAIIIMTIILKAALFPITKKSYESTSKMSAIQPKMKELQDKYKDDPQRMNKELSQLYQKEGVNPMSGCLPMVLQMPFLFAVYGLLNKYFDLRGAVFIPGWITDLSAPEAVYTFANFTIPLLKSSSIRLLPIIYVASQLISMKFTQSTQTAASGQSGMQQKMFMYVMPLMFFFILYNISSGLLIYWIVMNVLTTAQQLVINKRKAKEPKIN